MRYSNRNYTPTSTVQSRGRDLRRPFSEHYRKIFAILECRVTYFRNATWYRYARKFTTAMEGIIPYARHTFRYRYARKSTTAAESGRPYGRHTFRYRYARKTTTAAESLLSYARYTFRYRYVHQLLVAVESISANTLHTFRYDTGLATTNKLHRITLDKTVFFNIIFRVFSYDIYRFKPHAPTECLISYGRHARRNRNGYNSEYRIQGFVRYLCCTIGKHDGKTTFTGSESFFSYASNTRWYCKLRETRAAKEGGVSYSRYTFRYRYALKSTAIDESGRPYIRHPFRYCHFRQTAAISKGIRTYRRNA